MAINVKKTYFDVTTNGLIDKSNSIIQQEDLWPSIFNGENGSLLNIQFVQDQAFDTPYIDLPPTATAQAVVDLDYNNPIEYNLVKDDIDEWTASTVPGEFYYSTAIAAEPNSVMINGALAVQGTVGSLAAGEWGYSNTHVYVKLSDALDPDTKASGFVTYIPDYTPVYMQSLADKFNQANTWLDAGTFRNPVLANGEVTFQLYANTDDFIERMGTSPETANTKMEIQFFEAITGNLFHVYAFKFRCLNRFLPNTFTPNTTPSSYNTKTEDIAKYVGRGEFNLATAVNLQINAGAVTKTSSVHTIEPETSTTDDLVTISGGADSENLIIYVNDSADIITIKNATGNILTPDGLDYKITSGMAVFLNCDGTNWRIIGSSGVTNLSEGTSNETTVDVNSDTGDNATLLPASTIRAGLLTKAKFDEIVANTLKDTNVPTSLSIGTVTADTVAITSDGGADDVVIPKVTNTTAGLIPSLPDDALKYFNGIGGYTAPIGGIEWGIVAIDTNPLVKNNGYLVDCSSGVIVLTLPAAPAEGDTVGIADFTGSAATNNITVARNGNNIFSQADDILIDKNYIAFHLTYTNVTQGWVVTTEISTGNGIGGVDGDMISSMYDPASITEQLVGLTAAQELSNKTLVSPIINVTSDAQGDIYYRDVAGNFARLAPGTVGQFLSTNGAAADPSWSTPAGSGDVLGPVANTDLYIPQWDGTDSKTLKNGLAFIDDDTMGTASATNISSSESVKAYTDGLKGDYDSLYIDAGAMVSCTTNGATTGTKEYVTNDIDWDYFAFDTTTSERVQFKIAMPDSWDLGTIKAKCYWTSATSSTTGDTVEWGIKAGSLADSDAIDTVLGTAQVISDALLADNGTDLQITLATPAITVAGSPALGELTTFEVYRSVAGTDDMVEDAWLVGVAIQFKKLTTAVASW